MYTILKSSSSKDLIQHVKEYIKKGWKCAGGLCILNDVGTYWFYQSMVKEE